MEIKKILLLGGAYAQIPIIKESKYRGYYVITCDYLPDNPGHKLADEYYNVSTTDYDAVLELAKKLKPDFVVAYASDPAAPVAAYVSEKLNLPGNRYQSVRLLAEKDLFRNLLKKNGLNCPESAVITETDTALENIKKLFYPIIIKPTDSSGSKGISKVNNDNEVIGAVRYALEYSRKKKVIAEQFIDNKIADLHGDGFIIDGELAFCCLGDHLYNCDTNPFNPCGTLWPTRQPDIIVKNIEKDVAKIIAESGFQQGPINIEARVNSEGRHFIMEIGPRNGGHFVPQAIQYATGFNMVKATLDLLDGTSVAIMNNGIRHVAYYAIHSDISGKIEKINIDTRLKPFIKEFHQYRHMGDYVKAFSGANEAIGVLLLYFNTRDEMEHIMGSINDFITIEIV